MAEDAAAFRPIKTDKELMAWLESVKDRRIHSAFSARNALRCLPAALSEIDGADGDYQGVDLTIAVLRAALISGVVGSWPTPEMNKTLKDRARSAARSADSAALATDRSANSAARSAARSANSAANSADSIDGVGAAAFFANSAFSAAANSAFRAAARYAVRAAARSAAYSDGARLQNVEPIELFATPLWPEAIPVPAWKRAWADFQSRSQTNSNWVFWVKWYRSMLNGQPLDWDLQRRIALELTDEDWDKGPGTVARRIAEIETQYLKDTTHAVQDPSDPGDEAARHKADLPKLILSRIKITPPLVENPDSNKLTLAKESGPAADPVQFALNNIKMALDHALKTCGENGFDAQVEEVGILKLALETAPREARYVAPLLHHAYCILDRKLTNGEYPPEGSLSFLSNQLKAHVIGLSEDKPDVAKHIQSYGDLPEPEPITAEVVEELQDAAEKLVPVLEEDAREVVDEVTERIEPGAVPSKYRWALLVQWFAQIWLYLDKAKKHLGIADWIWEILKKLF